MHTVGLKTLKSKLSFGLRGTMPAPLLTFAAGLLLTGIGAVPLARHRICVVRQSMASALLAAIIAPIAAYDLITAVGLSPGLINTC